MNHAPIVGKPRAEHHTAGINSLLCEQMENAARRTALTHIFIGIFCCIYLLWLALRCLIDNRAHMLAFSAVDALLAVDNRIAKAFAVAPHADASFGTRLTACLASTTIGWIGYLNHGGNE